CEVVLVDSQSTDGTVEIARRFPIRIVRISPKVHPCPALGRVIGQRLTRSEYILFVDGDTEIQRAWLVEAVSVLQTKSNVAGVAGKVREVYYHGERVIGESPDFFNAGPMAEAVDQLGGNALYRRSALDSVGSFNPYLSSYEEAELAERLRQAGFVVMRIPLLLGTHRTQRRG